MVREKFKLAKRKEVGRTHFPNIQFFFMMLVAKDKTHPASLFINLFLQTFWL